MRKTPHSASPAGLSFIISAALRTLVDWFRTGRPVIAIPDDVSGFSACDRSLDVERSWSATSAGQVCEGPAQGEGR